MIRTTTCLAALLGAATLPAAMADAASITPISPPRADELTHAEIFDNLYGGSFSANGNDFTNGLVTLVRIDDDQDQSYNFGLGFNAEARAVYAGFDQHFGYTTDANGYVELFSIEGTRGDVAAQALSIIVEGDLQFVRTGPRGVTASTRSGDNVGGLDHVVTYLVDRPQARVLSDQVASQQYLLFFDDGGGHPNDRDFNDLVVLVTDLESTNPVPEPGSLALLGMGAGMLLRRRR